MDLGDNNVILISPIVGEISDNNVIFLITTRSSVGLSLYVNDDHHSSHLTRSIVPTRIVVNIPLSMHTDTICVWFYNNIPISEHKLRSSYNKMIFLSCDFPEADTVHSLWNKIGNDEKNGICFHIGDNIYGDHPYHDLDHNYNEQYVKTWSRWAEPMSDFSHMMVADDHEIADGYDYTKSLTGGVVAGLTAYKNYQASLLLQIQDVPGFFIKKVDHETTVYGISRTLMGMTILDKINQIKSHFTDTVILALSSAPVPLPPGAMSAVYKKIFGSTGWELTDLKQLYDICFSLLESGQVKRFILIGGDLHIGITGAVTKDFHTINVYVSSGVTAYPSPIEHLLAKTMNGSFLFEGYNVLLDSRAKRNYLTMALPISPVNPGTLVYNEEDAPKNWLDYIKEMAYMVK